MMFALLAIVGCKSTSEDVTLQVEENDKEVIKENVRFMVGGLEVKATSMDGVNIPMRRVSEPKDIGVTEIWVIEDGEVLAHQVSTDEDFGSPELILSLGKHTLTFIGSGKTGQKFVDGIWSADKISDTYGKVYELDVQQGIGVQQLVLVHANYAIWWYSDDFIVGTAKYFDIIIKGHHYTLTEGLNGGSATQEYKFSGSFTDDMVGHRLNITVSGFCAEYGVEETVECKLFIKNKNGNELYKYEVDVPVVSHRRSVITGRMFGSTGTGIIVDENWPDDYEIELP